MKSTPTIELTWLKTKRALGLPLDFEIKGHDNAVFALKKWKAKEVEARNEGDEEQSRLNSQMREMIRARGKKFCPQCGSPKNHKAALCQICHRKTITKKKIEINDTKNPRQKLPRPNNNARVHIAPVGGLLAEFGFFSTPVQKVMKKWLKVISQDILEDYFNLVALPVIRSQMWGSSEIRGQIKNRDHWQAVFELGSAIASIMAHKDKPEYWLLTMPQISVASGFEFEGWQKISERISCGGGPRFEPSTLAKTYSRLQMNTAERQAAAWRKLTSRRDKMTF